MSIHMSMHMSVHMSMRMCIHLSTHMPTNASGNMSMHISIHMSIHIFHLPLGRRSCHCRRLKSGDRRWMVCAPVANKCGVARRGMASVKATSHAKCVGLGIKPDPCPCVFVEAAGFSQHDLIGSAFCVASASIIDRPAALPPCRPAALPPLRAWKSLSWLSS